MNELSLDDVQDLLDTREIPGSAEDLKKLCIRIGELVDLNGEAWVRANRQNLLDQWTYFVRQGIITS